MLKLKQYISAIHYIYLYLREGVPMKSITIAVCEDNPSSLDYIQKSIQSILPSYGASGVVSGYTSSIQLLSLLQEGSRFQLYFLDIDMPGLNGLELAAGIRDLDKGAVILFVTAKEEYVFEAFRVQPFRFIRKSHFKAELLEAVGEYFRQREALEPKNILTLEVQNTCYRFDVNEIQYIQAKDNYLDIIGSGKNILIRYKISDMEKLLEPHQFLRVHKSYLVNYQYIYIVRNHEVILENGFKLPVSRRRADEVQQKFKEFIQCS